MWPRPPVFRMGIVGETGIAVGSSEAPQAAVNRVSTANRNLILFIGLILAHLILMPNRINQTRQDLSKPCPGFFLCIALWLFLRDNTHRGRLAFFSRTRPKWNSNLSFVCRLSHSLGLGGCFYETAHSA